MPKAVDQYIQAAEQRDPVARLALLEECFAQTGRFVTRSRVYVGPAEISEMIGAFLGNAELVGFHLTSAIDAIGTTFRYASVVEKRDGTLLPFFDAGELGPDGKIVTMLVFAGALQNA